MASYSWKVTYNGGALESFGAVFLRNTAYLSPIAMLTSGLVYGVGDSWFNLDDTVIQGVTWGAVSVPSTSWSPVSDPSTTWSPCDCDAECE